MVSQSHSGRLILTFIAFTFACISSAQPSAVASPSALIFAKVASDGAPSHVAKRYGKLVQMLGSSLNQKVVIQTRGSYEEMSSAMKKGAFDIVSGGPALYLDNATLYEPVARPIYLKKSKYRGVVFVKSNSKFRSLKDLKAARLGFVSERSSTGYLLPSLLLEAAGVKLDSNDKRMRFYGGDAAAVVCAVMKGEIDAGAVSEDALGTGKTRILAYSVSIPTDPILVKKSLPLALRQQIADFFSEAARRTDARAILLSVDNGLQGWIRTDAKDYEGVRRYRDVFFKGEKGGR